MNASSVVATTAVTVTLHVTSVNDAPVAQNQSIVVTGQEPISLTLSATDVDGDPLSYRIVDGATIWTGAWHCSKLALRCRCRLATTGCLDLCCERWFG